MICMVFLILAVYAVRFVCSLDVLDGSLRNFILFAEFGNLTGQRHALVSQLRRSILSAHLLDDFRPLCGKGFYPLGQTLAVVHDCLQRGKLVVVNKGVFCKDFLGVFPDALQFRAVDVRLLFLGQDTQLITVVQIQAVHLGFTEEYFEENLEDAFSRIGNPWGDTVSAYTGGAGVSVHTALVHTTSGFPAVGHLWQVNRILLPAYKAALHGHHPAPGWLRTFGSGHC